MRKLFLASATAAAVLAGFGAQALAQQQRGGGYPGGGVPGGQRPAGAPAAQPAPQGGGQPTGSFSQSCRNTQVQNGQLSAECLDTQGRYRQSSLPYGGCRGGVSNNNGVLYCEGATASAGAYVQNNNNNNNRNGPPQQGGYANNNNNNNYGRDNRDNNRAAGAIAGAIAGALGGELYAQGYSYPAYGDSRYGDPRYDPRYAQGGWGYGHRPGEWVWIRDRADWLNRQVDEALRDRALRSDEARDIHRDLDALVDRENSYRRQGMAGWMRADLDRRFDQIAYRVRDAERRRPDYRPDDRRDQGGYGGNGYGR